MQQHWMSKRGNIEAQEFYKLFKKEDYRGSLNTLLNKPKDELSDPVVQFFIGHCYYELDELDEAIKSYSNVIGSSSNVEKNAYFNRGLCWREKDEYEKALSDFLKTGGEQDGVCFLIGEMYHLMENYEESYKVLRGLSGAAKDNDVIAVLAADCNHLDKHEEALELFSELLKRGDQSDKTLNGIITELNWLDRGADVKKFMEAVLSNENDPTGSLREKVQDILEEIRGQSASLSQSIFLSFIFGIAGGLPLKSDFLLG